MKSIRNFLAAALLSAPLVSPVMAQSVGQVDTVRVEYLSAAAVKVIWDKPNFSMPRADHEAAYIVQIAENAADWVTAGEGAGRSNNILAEAGGGQSDDATPDDVTFFDACGRVGLLPASAKGSGISGTFAFLCNQKERDDANEGTVPDTLSVSYRGFTPGTKYKVRMRAYSPRPESETFGKFSDDVVFTIPTTAALGALTLREPSDIGDAGFTVNWTPAANAESYVIRWRTAANAGPDRRAGTTDDVAAGPWQNAAGDDTECNDDDTSTDGDCGEPRPLAPDFYRLTGLAARTAYDYEVRAVKEQTFGGWVAATPVGMPRYPLMGVAVGETAPRADFLRAGVTARSGVTTPNLRVLWDAPTTAAGDYAIVPQVRVQGGDAWTGISDVNSAATAQAALQLPQGAKSAEIASPPADHAGADITGLDANTMYEVRLVVFGRVTELDAFTATDTEATDAITARTNNNISTLSALTATNLLRITPPFMPTHTEYQLIPDGILEFVIDGTPTDPNATVTGNDDKTGGLFGETGVENHIVTVTAEDGVTTTDYTLRLAAVPQTFGITSIAPAGGGDALTFSPAASPLVFAYTAGTVAALTAVPASVHSVDITAEWTRGGTTKIGARGGAPAQAFASGMARTLPLEFGANNGVNNIDISFVSGEKEPVVYTIAIIRETPSASPAAVTLAEPSDISAHQFTINWLRQPDASEYAVRWRVADTVAAGPWQNAAGNDTECNDTDAANDAQCGELVNGGATVAYTISGLRSDTGYDYSVRALNENGNSGWTDSAAPVNTPVSTDSTLRALSVDGGDDVNLISFAAATTSYDLTAGGIRFGVDELDITAAVNVDTAVITQVTLDGTAHEPAPTSGEEFTVDISDIAQNSIAEGKIIITVTAEDETSTSEYVILFTRARAKAPDVNRDGEINTDDAFLIARYFIGLRGEALTAGLVDAAESANIESRLETEREAANPPMDVNADGSVTAADGILIARYFLGVESGGGLTAGQVDSANAADVPGLIELLRITGAAQAAQ